MSPWIYGSITGDFETPRKQTVGRGERKKKTYDFGWSIRNPNRLAQAQTSETSRA
jgi:hypothetical protein